MCDRWKINTRGGRARRRRRRIPERFPPGNVPPRHSSVPSLRPLFSRLSPRIFSNVFTNLRSLTRGVIILPAAPGRFHAGTERRWRVCARFFARVYVQRREYARPTRRELLFFPAPLLLRLPRGWNSFRGPTPSSPTNGTVRLLRLSLLYSSEAHPFRAHVSPKPTLRRRVFPPSALARESRFASSPVPVTPRNVRARRDKSGPATRRGNPVSRDAGVFKNRIDSASTFWGEGGGRGRRGKPRSTLEFHGRQKRYDSCHNRSMCYNNSTLDAIAIYTISEYHESAYVLINLTSKI